MATARSASPSPLPWKATALVAVCITLLQIAFVLAYADGASLGERYSSLRKWDANFYAEIIDNGYTYVPGMSSAGFFPAYAMLGKVVQTITRSSTTVSMLVAAQLAAAVFWFYFLSLLQRWKVDRTLQVLAAIAMAAYPTAFFMVVPYSESIFLASLFGWLFWMDDGRKTSLWIAAVHGFVLTASRVTALPLMIVPLLYGMLRSGKILPQARHWAVAGITGLGVLTFFAYCYLHFGDFFLYFRVQREGWGVVPVYLWGLDPAAFQLFRPIFSQRNNPWMFDHFSVALSLYALIAFAVTECVRRNWEGIARRLPLYACGVVMLYLPVAALHGVDLRSMSRYTLPVAAVLLPCLIGILSELRANARIRIALEVLLPLVAALSLFIQATFIYRFVANFWVA